MTTELDDDTRLKLIGLKALADDHNKHLDDIYRVTCATLGITKETDRSGTVSDFVYAEGGTAEDVWSAIQWQIEGEVLKAAEGGQ